LATHVGNISPVVHDPRPPIIVETIRPGGLVDHLQVATVARYFETNLGWRPAAWLSRTARGERCRCTINRWAPGFKQLTPFWPGA